MDVVWSKPGIRASRWWPVMAAGMLLGRLVTAEAEEPLALDTIGSVAAEILPLDNPPAPACDQPPPEKKAAIDTVQRGVYLGVCNTARWFDGLFGTRRFDQDSDATYGRLKLGESWDHRDGFDTRLRLRARFALPNMEDRVRLVFGRVDDREIIEDARPAGSSSLPQGFDRVDDEAWLLGLGYSNQSGLENGFDFGAGIKIRTPVDPYTKGSYRHNFSFNDSTAFRARQTVFWRDSRGLGETTELDLDYLLTPQLLLRWGNTGTLAEDVSRLEWTSALTLFQSLGDRRGLSYTTFVSGVANTDVPVRDYGAELRYRKRFLREWLFLEARASVTWPRETLQEERDINPGVGLGFEMYFGPVPSLELR
jgi:hypothetical protein